MWNVGAADPPPGAPHPLRGYPAGGSLRSCPQRSHRSTPGSRPISAAKRSPALSVSEGSGASVGPPALGGREDGRPAERFSLIFLIAFHWPVPATTRSPPAPPP